MKGRVVTLVLAIVILGGATGATGARGHSPGGWWTRAEARQVLLAAAGLVVVDRTQPDLPRFELTFNSVPLAQLKPLAPAKVTRGKKTWTHFRFDGAAHDFFTDSVIHVSFTIHALGPASTRRYRTSDVAGPAADTSQPGLPLRAAFYYPWFPETWDSEGIFPFTRFHPSLGIYDSSSPEVINAHIDAMRYGNLDAGIYSWFGVGSKGDIRLPRYLLAARSTPFRWAIYYEPEGYGDPSPDRLRSDLAYISSHYGSSPAYLRIGGRLAVFAYGDGGDNCSLPARWKQANTINAYIVLKVFPGFESCPDQPDGWHQYAPALADAVHLPWADAISPGFYRAAGEPERLTRDLTRWRASISGMVASGAYLQLVTTFNEWGEGTAVESAREWATPSGHGAYLDALHELLPAKATVARTSRFPGSAARLLDPSGQAGSDSFNGEGGIRTLEAGFSPPNALAGRRLQPLGHFSGPKQGTAPLPRFLLASASEREAIHVSVVRAEPVLEGDAVRDRHGAQHLHAGRGRQRVLDPLVQDLPSREQGAVVLVRQARELDLRHAAADPYGDHVEVGSRLPRDELDLLGRRLRLHLHRRIRGDESRLHVR